MSMPVVASQQTADRRPCARLEVGLGLVSRGGRGVRRCLHGAPLHRRPKVREGVLRAIDLVGVSAAPVHTIRATGSQDAIPAPVAVVVGPELVPTCLNMAFLDSAPPAQGAGGGRAWAALQNSGGSNHDRDRRLVLLLLWRAPHFSSICPGSRASAQIRRTLAHLGHFLPTWAEFGQHL